ncbi:MAG: hypothetical protein IPI58_04345 [Alphaproteobacteria bacterium]|nr:MAG: hypothetical protein IPI58_04345 [Alphaproteobacteria bacterium]
MAEQRNIRAHVLKLTASHEWIFNISGHLWGINEKSSLPDNAVVFHKPMSGGHGGWIVAIICNVDEMDCYAHHTE